MKRYAFRRATNSLKLVVLDPHQLPNHRTGGLAGGARIDEENKLWADYPLDPTSRPCTSIIIGFQLTVTRRHVQFSS